MVDEYLLSVLLDEVAGEAEAQFPQGGLTLEVSKQIADKVVKEALGSDSDDVLEALIKLIEATYRAVEKSSE